MKSASNSPILEPIEILRSLRRSLCRLPLLLFLLSCALAAGAMMLDDDPGDPGPPDVCLVPEVEIAGAPYVNGLPLIFETLEIVGDHVKVFVATRPQCRLVTPSSLPFQWQLVGPGGPVALTDEGTLRPHFRPSIAGAHEAQITYCPQTCINVSVGTDTVKILPQTSSFSFVVVNEIAVPPATQPVLTPTALKQSDTTLVDEKVTRVRKCGGPGPLYAQLVPVRPWASAADYQLLEGTVKQSRIAGKDNELNHTSHDIAVHVEPDLQHDKLKVDGAETMEIEWESKTYPREKRPLAGDRISAWGFHTYDCHHSDDLGIRTEIHPPVLTAVHRSRPVRIPDGWPAPAGAPLGSNIHVPGIVTDIWASAVAGEMTSNCSTSGLHQESQFSITGACIKSPHPLNRVFTFNIYLAENPQKRMAEVGVTAPPAPLYVGVDPPLQPGDRLVVTPDVDDGDTPQTDDDVTYLRVTLDLTGYGGTSLTDYGGPNYARRIVAGWVQPSPDNWGLEPWKVGISSLYVYNDHDPFPSDDGDWIFWAGTNNRDQEWTRLLNEDSVGEGNHNFGGRPWETGSADGDRSLGPHLLLFNPRFGRYFPGLPLQDLTQSLLIHASGYDAELWDDPVGSVNWIIHPSALAIGIGERRFGNQYGANPADYRLTYFFERLGPVEASLTDAGRTLAAAYTIRPGGARCTGVPRGVCVLFPEIEGANIWHPLLVRLNPGDPDLEWFDHPIYEPQEAEELSLTEIPLAELGRSILQTRERDPQRVEQFFVELRAEFDEVRGTRMESEFAKALPPFEAHLPADLWQLHFGDIDPTPVDLAVQRLLMSPPGAGAGQSVVFSAEIVNSGTGAAAPFTVQLEIDGTAVGVVSVSGLAPGVATTVDFPAWTATAGTHTARATADASARIAEPVEDNNALERRFVVDRNARGLPDLHALGVQLDPSSPRAGEALTFVAKVQNKGVNVLDAFVVRFIVDGVTVGEVTIAGLPARETIEVRSPAWAAVQGIHTLRVIVDAGNAVTEEEERNNEHARAFHVRAPWKGRDG